MKRVLQWGRYIVLFVFVSIGWFAAQIFKSSRENDKVLLSGISAIKDFPMAQADVGGATVGGATAATGGATGGTASCSVAAA